jgi:hypothetical protein
MCEVNVEVIPSLSESTQILELHDNSMFRTEFFKSVIMNKIIQNSRTFGCFKHVYTFM